MEQIIFLTLTKLIEENMKQKRFTKDFEEIDRSSHVKLHKSGKHWVRTVVSKLGLLRLFKSGSGAEIETLDTDFDLDKYQLSSQLLRGIMSAGAIASGGLFMADTVQADDIAMEQETDETLLAETDTVALAVTDTTELETPASTDVVVADIKENTPI